MRVAGYEIQLQTQNLIYAIALAVVPWGIGYVVQFFTPTLIGTDLFDEFHTVAFWFIGIVAIALGVLVVLLGMLVLSVFVDIEEVRE